MLVALILVASVTVFRLHIPMIPVIVVLGILIHVTLVKAINVYFHNFMLIIVFENIRVPLTGYRLTCFLFATCVLTALKLLYVMIGLF